MLKEISPQLLALSSSEKAEVIQLLSRSLNVNWRGISKTIGVCDGDACISGTRIPVWLIVNAYRLGISETQLLYDYPTLSAIDLGNVWMYFNANSDEIETAIKENEKD